MLHFLQQRPSPAVLWAALACLAASLVIVVAKSYAASFSGQADAYAVGEWFINYGGGFVRRGLGGTAIFGVAELVGSRPRALLFGILTICYAVTFLALAAATVRTRELTLLDLLLILSPFAALFPVLHGVAGQRKEVLLFALAGLAYMTSLGSLDSSAKYVLWSLVLGVLIAVHDGLIFFLPTFVLYLRVLTPPAHPMGWRVLFLGLPAAIVFALGYHYSSHVDVRAVCAAMDAHEKGNWCDASPNGQFSFAASWLSATALDGLRSVVGRYTIMSGALTVGVGLVGLLPVALALRTNAAVLRAAVAELPLPRCFIAAGIASLVVLFAVANDWNRWFYILTSLLTMIHFAAAARQADPV